MKLKNLLLIPLVIILVATNCVDAYASENIPYQSYNYDYWGSCLYTPAPYIPDQSISGTDLGTTSMVTPQDVFVADDGKVYICDTGNNRVLVLDSDYSLLHVITNFFNKDKQDTFDTPSGVFVTDSGDIYIADTNKYRIVVLNKDLNLVKIVSNPKSEVLAKDFQFYPLKVAVDYAGRIYVVAKNSFQGIMCFDENDNFTGYAGTINVTINAYQKFWRILSTKAQRTNQIQYIPTEFTGIDIAPDGFLYATNVDTKGTQSIRRLNPKGQDVIKKSKNYLKALNGKLSGDLDWDDGDEYGGASRIADVVYRSEGIYSVIDTTRGRIFTYDDEGDLLYIFGGMGSQKGSFKGPVALEEKDGKILVLDSARGELMTFTPTQYGNLINKAVSLRYNGDEASAVKVWKKVLKLNSNFELAYVGIGKSYLASGDNKKAMKNLKLGMNREYYSIAYKRYRDDILKKNLGYILSGILLLIALMIVRKVMKKRKLKGAEADE